MEEVKNESKGTYEEVEDESQDYEPVEDSKPSKGFIFGCCTVAAAVIGGIAYFVTRKPKDKSKNYEDYIEDEFEDREYEFEDESEDNEEELEDESDTEPETKPAESK